jgi:hypothetical protein
MCRSRQARGLTLKGGRELSRLGFIIVSAKMSAVKNPPKTASGGRTRGAGSYDARVSGFALVTGAKSGTTAIGIGDPEPAQNKRLMALMTNCTLVARTKKRIPLLVRVGIEASR